MRRSWGALRFCLLPAIAACGGGEGFGGFTGRLGPVGYSDGEGAVRIQHLRDRTLNVDCTVRADETGVLRCLPNEIVPVYFVGPDCDERVVPLRGDEFPRFVSVLEPNGTVPYEVGGAYEGSVDECSRAGLSAQPLGTLRRVGRAQVTLFAEVSVEREQIAADLDAVFHTLDDGSRSFGYFEDRRWGRRCRPQLLESGLYCGPSAYGFVAGHAEPTCSSETRVVSLPSNHQVVHGIVSEDFCGYPKLYELDPWPLDAPVYTTASSTCAVQTPSDDTPLYSGRVVDPALVLPTLEQVEEGEGRLVARQIAHGGRVLNRTDASFFDRELQERCWPGGVDGAVRCVPVHVDILPGAYRDAACTEPLRIAPTYGAIRTRYVSDADGEIYRLTDEVVSEFFVRTLGGACGSIAGTAACSSYRRVGARVEADFAELSYGPLAPPED